MRYAGRGFSGSVAGGRKRLARPPEGTSQCGRNVQANSSFFKHILDTVYKEQKKNKNIFADLKHSLNHIQKNKKKGGDD